MTASDLLADSIQLSCWALSSEAAGVNTAYAMSGFAGREIIEESSSESREIGGGNWARDPEPVLSMFGVALLIVLLGRRRRRERR